MTKKEIKVFCEYCGRHYKKEEIEKSVKGDEFIGDYCDKCSKVKHKISEVTKADALFPVEKGDRVVLICKNGVNIELWNDKFNLDYVIKLYKNPKKAKGKKKNVKKAYWSGCHNNFIIHKLPYTLKHRTYSNLIS